MTPFSALLDVSESERGRRRARCPPPSARATAPRRPSARPDRYLTAGRALADDANGDSGGATGLVAHSDTGTRKQTACQLRWRDVCRRGIGGVADRRERRFVKT